MKILVYGINFDPEPTGIGKYSGEMCARLAAMGHEVRVVTAPPYYPQWRVAPGWRNRYSRSRWQQVDVWRAPLWVPDAPNGRRRVLHLLSYAVSSLPPLLAQLVWRPQVVMVVAPALTCAPAGWLIARLCGARTWLHVQDFEVDAAYQLGLLSSQGWRKRLVNAVEHWLMQRFDRVSTISHRMLQRTLQKGVEQEALVYLPNWVDEKVVRPYSGCSPYRTQLGIGPQDVVALFSGTLGGKQGLELLPQAARIWAEQRPDVKLVICGDGVMKPYLEAECAGLPNVRLLPLQPYARLNELLGMADIHLLPQHPGAADLVMPSKLTAMLASGRPVVTTTHAGTELERVVRGCGRVVAPGDAAALAAAVAELADNAEQRRQLGNAARRHAEEHLGATAVLQRLAACLEACVNRSVAGVELPREAAQTVCGHR